MNIKPADKKGNKKKGQKKWKSGKDKEEKETRSCHYCKKPGHLKKNCYAWKRKQEEADKNQNTADLTQEVENAEVMNVMETDITESWIMDSGCSFHLCPKLEWFQDLQEADGSVLLGNNQACKVKGIGSVKFKLPDGSVKIITEVRYIPDIKRNLISLGALEKKGYSFLSVDGKMMVLKGSRLVMEAIRKHSLYYLLAEVVNGEINAVKKSDVSLWHLRLGHVSQGGIKQLVKQGVIQEAADISSTECDICVLGKSKKSSFPTRKHTSTQPMQYAHSDVWGPASVPTVGGGRYFISIIDDFSRKLWIYVMKEKSEAFDKFRIWCKEAEVEKGLSLKCLRTDNGLEFLSHKFDEFCKLKGIKRHRTVPNNPQQNGVAERANRTILERVRCMLISSGMHKRLWGEAASTAAVLINKCPSSAIEMQTPDYRWYGSYGSYTMLKPFGCLAYSHIKQSKLEPRTIKCVMLGYQKGVKGYKLWSVEPSNQKVIVSRDVTFRELEMPYKATEKSAAVSEKTTFEVELLDELKLDDEQVAATDSEEEEAIQNESEGQSTEANEDLSDYLLARDR